MRLKTPGDNGDKNDVVTGYGRSLFQDSSELTNPESFVHRHSCRFLNSRLYGVVHDLPAMWGGY